MKDPLRYVPIDSIIDDEYDVSKAKEGDKITIIELIRNEPVRFVCRVVSPNLIPANSNSLVKKINFSFKKKN